MEKGLGKVRFLVDQGSERVWHGPCEVDVGKR